MDTLTPESQMAEDLGIKREIVAELRKRELQEGVDFLRTAAGILYTPAAVTRMLDLLAAAEEARVRPKGPEEAVLEIVRQVPNPLIVLAVRARPVSDGPHADGPTPKKAEPPLTLKVPHMVDGKGVRSNLFRARMLVKARHVEGAVWTYIGPRPRYLNDPACCVPKSAPAKPAAQEGEKGAQ